MRIRSASARSVEAIQWGRIWNIVAAAHIGNKAGDRFAGALPIGPRASAIDRCHFRGIGGDEVVAQLGIEVLDDLERRVECLWKAEEGVGPSTGHPERGRIRRRSGARCPGCRRVRNTTGSPSRSSQKGIALHRVQQCLVERRIERWIYRDGSHPVQMSCDTVSTSMSLISGIRLHLFLPSSKVSTLETR